MRLPGLISWLRSSASYFISGGLILWSFAAVVLRVLMAGRGKIHGADLIGIQFIAVLLLLGGYCLDHSIRRIRSSTVSAASLGKRASRVERLYRADQMSLAIPLLGVAALLLLLIGVTIPIALARQPSHSFRSRATAETSFLLVFVWSYAVWPCGLRIFNRLARRRVDPGSPHAPKPPAALYDRELDHEFAPESRPVP